MESKYGSMMQFVANLTSCKDEQIAKSAQELMRSLDKRREDKDLRLPLETVKAWFHLSGLKVLHVERLVNGYDMEGWTENSPWWYVKTQLGYFKIGWRKRVINVDWSDTGLKYTVSTNNTTWEYGFHAYSDDELLRLLKTVTQNLTAATEAAVSR